MLNVKVARRSLTFTFSIHHFTFIIIFLLLKLKIRLCIVVANILHQFADPVDIIG